MIKSAVVEERRNEVAEILGLAFHMTQTHKEIKNVIANMQRAYELTANVWELGKVFLPSRANMLLQFEHLRSSSSLT